MRSRSLGILALTLSLVLFATVCPAQKTEVRRMDYDGLMDYIIDCKGAIVLVNFWATWCGPCLKELPGLMLLREEIPEDKLRIVGVSLDYDPKTFASYVAKKKINFPNYLAAPDLMDLLEIQSIPKMLLFDCDGMEIISHEGYIPLEELRPKIEALLPGAAKTE